MLEDRKQLTQFCKKDMFGSLNIKKKNHLPVYMTWQQTYSHKLPSKREPIVTSPII